MQPAQHAPVLALRSIRPRGGSPLAVLACAGLLSACSDPYEPERGPNMDALVEKYETPTAQIDPQGIANLLAQAGVVLGALQLMNNFSFLNDGMLAAKEGFEVGGLDFDGELPLVGKASVHLICPGLIPGAEPNATQDGVLELQTPIEDGFLGPVAFGEARACRFNGDAAMLGDQLMLPGDLSSRDIQVDGPISIHLGDALALGKSIELKPLVQIHGTLDVEGLPALDDVHFRTLSPEFSETLVPLPNGQHFIVFSDQLQLGIREQRGIWLCPNLDYTQCLPDF